MSTHRRHLLAQAAASLFGLVLTGLRARAQPVHPDPRWYIAAARMRSRAQSWGDQSYGAVVVIDDAVVGEGPSRVVRDMNEDAHAERVAILDAQRWSGRETLRGAVLYSTSRPCLLCEAAAQRAGVTRMFFGPALEDAGPPRARAQ